MYGTHFVYPSQYWLRCNKKFLNKSDHLGVIETFGVATTK